MQSYMLKLLQFLIVIGQIESVLSVCPHSYPGLQKLSRLNKDETDFSLIFTCLLV